MKGILAIILSGIFMLTGCGENGTQNITLDQIATAFNSRSDISIAEIGYGYSAEVKNNKLVLTSGYKDKPEWNSEAECTLRNGILSIELTQDDLAESLIVTKAFDTVSMLQGNKQGDLEKSLSSLEKDITNVEYSTVKINFIDEQTIKMSMDTTKNFEVVDFSNIYITEDDIVDSDDKENKYLHVSTSQSKGNVQLSTSPSRFENSIEIQIAEEGQLTANTYKSLLSTLNVLFKNKDVVKYFTDNYSSLDIGNKEFGGFKMEVNPEDRGIFDTHNHPMIRLTIDFNTLKTKYNNLPCPADEYSFN